MQFSSTVANDLRRSATLDEDYEVQRFAATFRWGLRNGTEAYLEVPWLARGGGFLDPIIDAWHRKVLGWTDPIRDSLPQGRSVAMLGGKYRYGSASGLGDLSGGIARDFGERTTVRLAAKLPTGRSRALLGSGGLDAGLSVEHRIRLSRQWRMAVHLGIVAQSPGKALPSVRGLVDQEGLAIAYVPNSRDQWIAQWNSERAPATTGVPAADGVHSFLTFAYRRKLSPREAVEAFFSEDRDVFEGDFPTAANVAPDLTLGLRYVWRF